MPEATSTRAERLAHRLRSVGAGTWIALAYFLLGLATLRDYAPTWDEPESYYAGRQNLAIAQAALRGDFSLAWPFHELTGYQFLFDTVRAVVGETVNRAIDTDERMLGYHAFNLTLAALVLAFLHAFVRALGGGRALAALATLALALTPKFVAHSQSNPKDIISLFMFSLVALLAARVHARPTGGRTVALGLGLGVALASHALSAVLLPLLALGALLPAAGRRARAGRLAVVFLVAGIVALACWPWLWPAPFSRGLQLLAKTSTFETDLRVLFLGRVYRNSQPPATYLPVCLLVSLPVGLLVPIAAAVARTRSTPYPALQGAALTWAAALLAMDQLAPSRYDGVRHFLPILPPLAVLAAVGLTRLWEAAGNMSARTARAARAALVLLPASIVPQLVHLHPYHDAYLNEVVNLAGPSEPERYFELEYWGAAYREGARWFNAHAEPDAVIVAPIEPRAATRYLDRRFNTNDGGRPDPPPGHPRPRYLMYITRVALYKERIRAVEERAEAPLVFAIRRQRATLLKIWKIRGPDVPVVP